MVMDPSQTCYDLGGSFKMLDMTLRVLGSFEIFKQEKLNDQILIF